MHVIRTDIVAKAFQRLRERRIHPLFAGYLHLQQKAREARRLEGLRPDFLGFYKRFFRVASHPVGTPYIKPFIDTSPSQKNLWMNPNIAGTYAPSSLRPNQPFRRVVVTASKKDGYSLHRDHARLAFEHLLYRDRLPLAELVLFMYRDFGFMGEATTINDLIACFAVDFGYAGKSESRPNDDFRTLFDTGGASAWTKFTESYGGGDEAEKVIAYGLPRTKDAIRTLSADDLLGRGETVAFLLPLRRLSITGLLSFNEQCTFDFGKLNILVGPNGSGKSNLIDCLRLLRNCPQDIQGVFRGGFEDWVFRGRDESAEIPKLEAVVHLPQIPTAVRHEIGFGPPVKSRAPLEEAVMNAEDTDSERPYFIGSYRSSPKLRGKRGDVPEYDPFQSIVAQVRDISQYPEVTRLAGLYSSMRIYSEWSFGRGSPLRESAPAGRSDRYLSEDMDDLPIALNALYETPAHEKIRQLLPELKETYKDYATRLLFHRVGLELVETPFQTPVPASRLSDGTLRFLAMAAILLQVDPQPLVCLEEPELGMHPDAIRMLAEMIAEASGRTQIIITTHSEHLLTALQNDFDCLFAFDAGISGTVVRRFTQEQYQKWRQEHRLGELWSSGELGGVRW